MGMGHYPNYADVVSEDFVKEICRKEYLTLNNALEDAGIDFGDFSYCEFNDFDEDRITEKQQENINKAWNELKKTFDSKTGFTLYVVYTRAEDRGDELDGGSFAVDNVYCYTIAGKKYKDKINRKFWNNFG